LKLYVAGANVKGMAAIFTYGFAVSEENFKMLILISLLEQLSKFIKFSCCQTVYQ
jgi:hypothetical protein